MLQLKERSPSLTSTKIRGLANVKSDLLAEVNRRRIIVLDLSDDKSVGRLQWLLTVGLNFELCIIENHNVINFQKIAENNDVFIISCKIKNVSPLLISSAAKELHNRSKILLTGESDPESRAAVLNYGFDDIIDIKMMDAQEFISRIAAIDRRCGIAAGNISEVHDPVGEFVSLCPRDDLNRKQRVLLRKFLNAPDRTVTAEELRMELSSKDDPITENHLKVILTQTRKKLRRHVKIVSVSRLGRGPKAYQLQIFDMFGNLVP